jgi:Tfp pilus assembly protein PilW
MFGRRRFILAPSSRVRERWGFALRGGFTLMELMLGMLITSLVTGAIAALLSAVAQGWNQCGDSQGSCNLIMLTHLRLQRILRAAKQLGYCNAGSIEGSSGAAIMIWKADTNLDGLVQFSELGLIEQTPADGKIRYYEVVYPSSWTAAQKTTADTPALANDAIYDESSIDTFKALSNVTSTVIARNVTGAEFYRYDGLNVTHPTLDYLLNFHIGSTTETQYGTVAVRTPTTLPTSQGGPS